jgi:SAM-dependent methyltransferase
VTTHIQQLTGSAVEQRFNELLAEDPAWRVLSYILGPRVWEYAHAAGPRDNQFRALVPNIPPEDLRSIVAAPEEEVFLWTGANDLELFLNCFTRHGALFAGAAIFDFGCGCGRLSRYFAQSDLYRCFASDVNPKLVRWCNENLATVETRLNMNDPPLPFSSEFFDCAYSLSIFSHLPETASLDWLVEVSRVVKPNGLFVFTTHGHHALEIIKTSSVHMNMFAMTADEAQQLQTIISNGGFGYVRYPAGVLEVAKAGPDYGNAFVSEMRIRAWLGSHWELTEFLPGGLRGWQDVTIVRRK